MDLTLLLIFLLNLSILNSNGEEHDRFDEVEQNILSEFRSRVSDVIVHEYQNEDGELMPWLKAKNMDLQKAEEMFREAQEWRLTNGIDSIENETILELNPLPYVIDGYSNEGYPIVIFTPTFIDMRKLVLQGLRDKMLRYWYQMMERVTIVRRASSKKFGRHISKVVAILEIDGFNLKQHACLTCISIFREFVISLEKYYPEVMAHLVFINVHRIAIPILELLRPLFSPTTRKALRFFPPDRQEWSAYLDKIIPPDQLPYRFGGTKKN